MERNNRTTRITVALAEDHGPTAERIRQQLLSDPQIEVLACEPNGQELLASLAAMPVLPDLILMDIQMPLKDGITTTAEVKTLYPEIRVLALTTFDDDDTLLRMIQAGASGYLLKDTAATELIQCLNDAMEGHAPLSPSVAVKILRLVREAKQQPAVGGKALELLSQRECEVLELIRDGLQNKEIADRLFISPQTVRKHIEHIYKKLQVNNRVEAIRATE